MFTTGDVGYLDDDGYLWLSDRKIDMIISGGVNIYPAEIEGVLGGHDAVADVAVIGVPNEEFGEEVKAIVAVTDGVVADAALADELRAYCRDQLAGYKVPRSIDFVDELPTHRHRQDPEGQAARALLGRPGTPDLTTTRSTAPSPSRPSSDERRDRTPGRSLIGWRGPAPAMSEGTERRAVRSWIAGAGGSGGPADRVGEDAAEVRRRRR